MDTPQSSKEAETFAWIRPEALKIIEQPKGSTAKAQSSINKAYDVRKKTKPKEAPASHLVEASAASAARPPKAEFKLTTRDNKLWTAKVSPTFLTAVCEVIGQEIIRLCSPKHTHKTRFANLNGKLGVISEKIVGYSPIEENFRLPQNGVARRTFLHGLGMTTLLSAVLNETDLKLEHIDKTTGEKIDGDYLFSFVQYKKFLEGAEINEAEISALPYRIRGNPHQWLDQIQGEQIGSAKHLIFKGLNADPDLRSGVNEAALRLLLVQDEQWKALISSHIVYPETVCLLFEGLKNQLTQLKEAMLKNESFKSFVRSPKAEEIKSHHLMHLRDFKIIKKLALINIENYGDLKTVVNRSFDHLKRLAPMSSSDASFKEKSIKMTR
ncbi:MAG: hypothetical protein P4M14_07605 [Gammaproteobacteria bacterium]|nr:hypothetical protein [Gammaproteobacteria bacterium]